MSCKLPPAVTAYLEAVEADKPRACPEQHALAAHIRRCFETEDLRVDTEQLRRYLSLSRYFPYKDLFLWEQQRPEAENAYFRFSVRSEAFHAPSSFTMVMVPVTLAVVVPSAACRSAEKS